MRMWWLRLRCVLHSLVYYIEQQNIKAYTTDIDNAQERAAYTSGYLRHGSNHSLSSLRVQRVCKSRKSSLACLLSMPEVGRCGLYLFVTLVGRRYYTVKDSSKKFIKYNLVWNHRSVISYIQTKWPWPTITTLQMTQHFFFKFEVWSSSSFRINQKRETD